MALRLKAELAGDGSGFDAMMKRANATKDKFASSFSGLKSTIAGVFTVGAVTALSRKTIDLAGHLRDVSDALAVNVEWFQKRANAAALAGGSEDDLFKLLGTLNKSREEAFNQPGGEMAQRFGRLGFSSGDISGLNAMEFFDKLTVAFANGADQQANVDVEKVGGRSARNLLAAFYNGFSGGVAGMSEDLINQLDDIGDQFTMLSQSLTIGLAPAIVWVAEKIKGFVDYLKQVGSFWGGFFSANGNDPTPVGWRNGMNAIISEVSDQEAADDALRQSRDAARAARRRREQAPPSFSPLELEKASAAAGGGRSRSGPGLITDSLVGIGNFLGRNPGLVNSVASQQLAVARQQLTALQGIWASLKKAPAGANLNDLQVPLE